MVLHWQISTQLYRHLALVILKVEILSLLPKPPDCSITQILSSLVQPS